MKSWTAFCILPDQAAAERLGAALERLDPPPGGIGVFEIEDGSGRWEVGGYFTDPPDAAALALLAAAFGVGEFTVSELPEQDWVAHVRRNLPAVEAGRFFVYGSHDADRLPAGRIGLLIEASMAFGTGHHGTTQGCLLALDALAEEGFRPRSVADVGCGTAVLAMAAARLFPEAAVVAGDIDEVAIEVARANLKANGLSDRVVTVHAPGIAAPEMQAAAPHDLIFANILKGPLMALAPEIAAAAAPGGRVILSGLLEEQAEEVIARYGESGLAFRRSLPISPWITLVLEKSW